jgi:vacuolar-type H+-ATPase subunit I/STV1
VEDFKERFNRGDIRINIKAFDMEITHYGTKTDLGHILPYLLSCYEVAKSNKDNVNKFQIANECNLYIKHARVVGVINETESITSKLEKCDKEKDMLKESLKKLEEEKNELMDKYLKVMKDVEEYKKALNTVLPKRDDFEQ